MNLKRFQRLVETARALKPPVHSSRCFHVTFIIRKGKVSTIGINNGNKTHPRNLQFNYTSPSGQDLRREVGIHSEISSIIRGGREDYSDSTFVNIRIGENGRIMNSRPCLGCQSAMEQVGFKKFYYSDDGGGFTNYTS